MNVLTKSGLAALTLFITGTALLTGCRKDPVEINPVATGAATTSGYVDNWILKSMQDYYYWNTKLPANPDTTKDPKSFFYSLLYDYGNTANAQRDRFSWIQESSADLTALLSGQTKTTGMDFSLARVTSAGTDVVGVVMYVLPGSPADKVGVKRGDTFYSVNGITLTTDQTVLSKAFADESVTQTYGFATISNGVVTNSGVTKSVTPVVFQENPVFKDSVYTVGSKKIGYLLYNQFVPGPNGSKVSTYDNQITSVFGKFKAQGVNELILDLRYNGGGAVTSSINLASLIVRGVNGQTNVPFIRQEYNNVLTPALQKEYGNDIFYDYFDVLPNNIGSQLSRLYVIATGRTASASELIINGLRPYMTVNTIGSTTYGKNVGSTTITDDNNPKNQWGLQPIISRSYNKNNESNYWTGFAPTVAVNEPLGSLLPLGDLRDPMLATAINHMNGLTGGRTATTPNLIIGSSDDFRANANTMYIKLPGTVPGSVKLPSVR